MADVPDVEEAKQLLANADRDGKQWLVAVLSPLDTGDGYYLSLQSNLPQSLLDKLHSPVGTTIVRTLHGATETQDGSVNIFNREVPADWQDRYTVEPTSDEESVH